MPAYYEWTSSKKEKVVFRQCPRFEVSSHPLKIPTVTVGTSKSFIDNLNKWSSAFEEVDPLLRFEQISLQEDVSPVDDLAVTVNYNQAWGARRGAILNKYTTGEKLTILSSYLPGGEKTLIRQVSNLNEKVKHRLEQLDDFEEGSMRKTMGLSQQEFITNINMLSNEIKKAWDSEQRVKAFKIGIQCSKMLSDVAVMQFYPSKFILITDILDSFGNLVFDRLRGKSFGEKEIKTIQDINPESVPETAKETCQNWIFKMASIRELLPRLYMEMALLKCYVFINKEEIKPAIARLTAMIRGVGNPLVAVYLRAYLCRVGSNLLGNQSEVFFYDNFVEFQEEYAQVFHPAMVKTYEGQLVTLDKYLTLYVPAINWLLYGTLNYTKCRLTLLEEFLQRCQKIHNSELVLSCLVSSFDSSSVTKKATDILNMVQNNCDKPVLQNEILTALGEHLCHADNLRNCSPEALTQSWWKIASNMKNTSHFLQVLAPWLQFASSHLSSQHVNMLMRGTIRYLIKCGTPVDQHSGPLHLVVRRLLQAVPDVEELFLMDAFMPLVELVQTTNARTLMAKTVLSIFFDRCRSERIEDHIVISSLMRLCCILHDSINAVTVEDESKVCAELITKFVQAVCYQEDVEHQLNLYVECRAAFIKLDTVLVALVQAVNALSTRVDSARGKWMQRACAAYCFVTVPSLRCPLTKSQLYLLGGQVALLNNCVGQAEANFKALVSLIPDIPEFIMEDAQKKPTNIRVEALLSDFLSTMLILPDNVDSNCKAYILSGFIKTMERIHWKKTDSLYYNTLLRTLDLLCHMTRENYVYHIDAVISNDKLYGSDTEFIETIEKYATNICQELLVVLKALGDARENRKQYHLALELFWRVVRRGNLQEGPMVSLAANLWVLSQKLQDSNNKLSLLVLALCEGVLSKDEDGFVEPLDFSQFFESGSSGVSPLASGRIAAAMLNVDKSHYPQLFDTIVSSSIDSLQTQVGPKDSPFSPEHYGFNPIASSGFHPPRKAARIVAQPHQVHRPKKHPTHLPLQHQQNSPLLYDIKQIHDAEYKVYKPEDEEQDQGEILAALRKDPSVSAYFKPAHTNVKVSHPLKYRKQELVGDGDDQHNYRPDAYITGSSRIRRYAGSKKSEKLRSSAEEEEEEPYDYKADYVSRPKAFDSDIYSSAYKDEKEEDDNDERNANKDYEYPYEGYDTGYDDKEYERIKELSEKQAAEIKQNPGNCKEVLKDGMTCMTCKDPKTGGNYESCSYVAEPKNNKYAYSKAKKFDTNDQPDEPEEEEKAEQREEVKDDSGEYPAPPPKQENTHEDYKKEEEEEEPTTPKYNAYYTKSSKPLYGAIGAEIRAAQHEAESSEEKDDSLTKPYNYKKAIPEFYTDNEPKKDVEHVLAEFKKKDRSTCKKVYKGGMTCFQCIDKTGLKNEECMFVSESAPKRSHLAYQEVKEFTSKPPTLDASNEGAESVTITTNAPLLKKSAAYVVAPNGYGKKLKYKKTRPALNTSSGPPYAASPIIAAPVSRITTSRPKVKRSVVTEKSSAIIGESPLAPPEEFAGDSSKGAFWAETVPRYSAALGVTLPAFMLARSEHEALFDETVAGA